MKTDERLEDQLRDLFTALTTDEPPLVGTRSPARTARRRIFPSAKWSVAPVLAKGLATAGLAGAMAAGAVVGPRIARDDAPDGTGGLVSPTSSASLSPSASASPSPTPSRALRSPDAGRTPAAPPVTRSTGDPKPHPPGDPAPDCTPTNNGSVMTSIVQTCDTASEAILRFAAKRIDGTGAEAWMTTRARSDYDAPGDELWLYTPPGERAYKSYFVTERVYLDDGRIRFTLEMNQGYVGDQPDRVRTEWVYVGGGTAWDGAPTANGMVVLSAALVAGPDPGTTLGR